MKYFKISDKELGRFVKRSSAYLQLWVDKGWVTVEPPKDFDLMVEINAALMATGSKADRIRHIKQGIIIGIGLSAVCLYLYKKGAKHEKH